MTKPIILTTGNADLSKLSGSLGFSRWFYQDFAEYAQQTQTGFNHEGIPLHIVLPIASTDTVQDQLLDRLESMDISNLHIEFQPFDQIIKPTDYFIRHATIYRQRIVDSLRARLDRSNWDALILTGLTQDQCRDVIDLHLRLDVLINYPVTGMDCVQETVSTVFKRATIV